MVTPIPSHSPARLFRSAAPSLAAIVQGSLEQVGDGRFDKMVRIALSDPDDEVWRYAIGAAGQILEGDAIRRFAPLSTNPA